MPNPMAVFMRRRESMDPFVTRRWPAQTFNQRVPVQERQQDPPLPIITSRAWPIGKTYDHAWGHVWPYITLRTKELNSIVNPLRAGAFLTPRKPGTMVVYMAGNHQPITAHVNIDQPSTGAYGSRSSVQAPPTYVVPPNYFKLL